MESSFEFFTYLLKEVPGFLMSEPISYFVGVALGLCIIKMMKTIIS